VLQEFVGGLEHAVVRLYEVWNCCIPVETLLARNLIMFQISGWNGRQ
jgi:hypothetical protein